jgi:hypothetical protein
MFQPAGVRFLLGRLAQLVEHLVYTERVGGSSPSPPTTFRSKARHRAACLSAAALMLLVPCLAAPARADDSMTFSLTAIGTESQCQGGCAEVIIADGEINNDTADQFLSFLSDHLKNGDLRPVILLQSPGGTVKGAMNLGSVFRKIGAAVIVAGIWTDPKSAAAAVVPGSCYSACVYAFLGGKRRVVPPVSRLGIHRMVISEEIREPGGGVGTRQIFGSEDIVASLSAYTKLMGVDPRLIAFAEHISPDKIHIVTPAEIARWHLGSPRL